MIAQIDIFAPRRSAQEVAAESRRTGLIPTVDEADHLNAEEMDIVARAWIAGTREVAESDRHEAARTFAARGWPFAWLLATGHAKADALLEAVDVVERYFTPALVAGAQQTDSMGIAQNKGFGGCEGIQLKQPAYCRSFWLVSVYCVTGPVNFSVGEGVEFEPGAKSHVFHLLYRALPDRETLAGDIAAHPLITDAKNRPEGALRWSSEGWMGPAQTAPCEHRSWPKVSECDRPLA